MTIKKEYLENIDSREFYDFYRRNRKKTSPKINQEILFKKAIHGLLLEIKKCAEETGNGVHLRGFGVLHKRRVSVAKVRLSLFTYTKKEKNGCNFYLEDDYLRNLYLIKNVSKYYNRSIPKRKYDKDKPDAIILHRKLIRKSQLTLA